MRSNELNESTEGFEDKISDWVEGQGNLKKLTSYPEYTDYQNPSGDEMYRVWSLSLERVRKLIVLQKTITLKPKKKALSFSWSYEGAKAVTEQGYGSSKGRSWEVYVKKQVEPNTIILNLYDWAKKNPDNETAQLIMKEKEVLVEPTEYYLSINRDEIVNFDKLVELVTKEWPGYKRKIKPQNS